MGRVATLGILFLIAGCSATSPVVSHQPPLVQRLAGFGLSDSSTRKIVLVGSEGGYGGDVQVTISEEFLIQEVWDSIYQSRPYGKWCACGFRRLQFYSEVESEVPAVELLVNATDRCHFAGAFDEGFRCPGINKILEPLLKREYEQRQSR
jgi:hypothetical protein